MVEQAVSTYGRVDILYNNAAIEIRGSATQLSEADWDATMGTNVKGSWLCAKYAIPEMQRAGGGVIINSASTLSYRVADERAAYVASKGAVLGFTRALAREIGPDNVSVNAVTPGAIATEGEKVHANPDDIARIMEQQCLQRRILPVDVARVCLFLASELSDGMTGQTVNVDGGLVMY